MRVSKYAIMVSMSWKPSVFEFTDFRAFLSAYYLAAKSHQRGFSFRSFSKRAGFSSPNFLKLVIDGQRNLSQDSVVRFSKALGLGAAEGRFFADLVTFGQAETHADRNAAFERIAASRRFREARRLDHSMFVYLSHWYYPAIREMAARPDFIPEPAWVASQLLPPIEPSQAAAAIELLLGLGLLVRDASGRVRRGDPTITTGHEVRSLAAANFHRQMLERAGASIELVPREHRDVSGQTVCISAATVQELKARIHAFRESCLDLCDRDNAPESVYQLAVQLFPLSRIQTPAP